MYRNLELQRAQFAKIGFAFERLREYRIHSICVQMEVSVPVAYLVIHLAIKYNLMR